MVDSLPVRSLDASKTDTLLIVIDSGLINIKQSNDNMIKLSGMAPIAQCSISTISEDSSLTLQIPEECSTESVYLVEIPPGKAIRVNSNRSNVNIAGYQGDVTIHSTSGNIEAKNMTGKIVLRSGRGNVKAVDCKGEIRVLGEHGVLTMKDIHGLVTSSTIMGTINFSGSPLPGDRINLEVDHGPIVVNLGGKSNLSYFAYSASGEVHCSVPGTEYLSRACRGSLGNGAGELTIRSVSGKINVSILQLVTF
jgi:DUF4097 and DUF4098 domain-containing protein YvlB